MLQEKLLKMSDFIKKLEIKNFKSIKNLQLDCKRVNILIGKPNVGKSNILEALSLLGGTYSLNEKKYFSEFIRYDNLSELFYDKKHRNPIEVNTDKVCAFLRFHNNSIGSYDYMVGGEWINEFLNTEGNYSIADINKMFNQFVSEHRNEKDFDKYILPAYIRFSEKMNEVILETAHSFSVVKKYDFKSESKYTSPISAYLAPPNGRNLFTILYQNEKLQEEINTALDEYGLQFVYKDETKEFEILKSVNRNITLFPYSSMADTFQRLFFYLAAIESNKNTTLLFEEPEAHSYPPYIWQLANRIAHDSHNQYFISTHSPFIIETLLQELKNDEINVWVTGFENYETKIHVLQANDLQEMYDMGADAVFFNMAKFEKVI